MTSLSHFIYFIYIYIYILRTMGSPLFLGFLNKQWLPPCFEAFILNSLLLCLCSNFVALSLWKFFLLINWTWLGLLSL